MKKLITAVLLCSIVLLSLCSFTPIQNAAAAQKAPEVVTIDKEKVLEKRFLNMLNHSFVYNDDFYDDEALLNASALALLSFANGGFVEEAYLKDYAFNMYGKIYDDFNDINAGAPKAEGLFYIIPRGYDIYEHSIVSVTENADGSYTVVTKVIIDYHFGEKVEAVGTTLFLPNEESQFGFNILYSDLTYPLEYAMAI